MTLDRTLPLVYSFHATGSPNRSQLVESNATSRLTPPFPVHHNRFMRVIAGEAKGRRLRSPRGTEIRPTSDKVKEALFSILGNRVVEARFLDLFAGTGAIGIEALSRGAARVDFVESDRAMADLLEKNLAACGFQARAEIHRTDAFKFIKQGHGPYDLIFADPPYHAWQLKKLLPAVERGAMISPDGLLVVEHYRKIALPVPVGRLRVVRAYEYGDTVLTVYRGEATE
ncbi:MAG TPA: 16S rRNA (guanine(966)-N(2))-methyltransferase RsmD [Nitrospiria bacterium]|nr:16S rRNA (guanine(966)-N(2))-methyltransferase RsmD [Nitrospiria bacterium]